MARRSKLLEELEEVAQTAEELVTPAPQDVPAADMAEALGQPLTINGHPIPDHLLPLVPFRLTDQGANEFNRGKEVPRVQLGADALDKSIQRFGDLEPWEAASPIDAAVDRVREPGKRYHIASPRVIEKEGFRGWIPEKDEAGREVKLGNMLVCSMPEERAQKRDRHFAELTRDQVREAIEDLQVSQEKAARDSGGYVAPLKSGDFVRGVSPSREGYVANETPAEIGLHSVRGNNQNVR